MTKPALANLTFTNFSFTKIVSAIFGTPCPGCMQVTSAPCNSCNSKISLITNSQSTPKFHNQYLDNFGSNINSANIIVAFGYSTVIRKMILGLKYRNMRSSLSLFAGALAERIAHETLNTKQEIDFITWAPTTSQRKLERGHDHAELIARFVARELQVPCRSVLHRLTNQPQTGRSKQERLVGPQFLSRELKNQCVVVIDDVVTTGATLAGASQALYKAGAGRVICAAVASTVLWQSSIESCAPEKARRSKP